MTHGLFWKTDSHFFGSRFNPTDTVDWSYPIGYLGDLKFVRLKSSPVGWRTCAMVERELALMREFVDFQSAIPATRSRSEVAYRSCGSTMVPVTACILSVEAKRLSS